MLYLTLKGNTFFIRPRGERLFVRWQRLNGYKRISAAYISLGLVKTRVWCDQRHLESIRFHRSSRI